jgi:hypothetical protein
MRLWLKPLQQVFCGCGRRQSDEKYGKKKGHCQGLRSEEKLF